MVYTLTDQTASDRPEDAILEWIVAQARMPNHIDEIIPEGTRLKDINDWVKAVRVYT